MMGSNMTPFDEMEQFFEQMSRQFEQAARTVESGEQFSPLPWGKQESPVDLIEYDDELLLLVDLPGFEQEDVELTIQDNRLRLKATREETTVTEDAHVHRQERRRRTVNRSIRLPDIVDEEAIAASMSNGVLEVTLPKRIDESVNEIEIE